MTAPGVYLLMGAAAGGGGGGGGGGGSPVTDYSDNFNRADEAPTILAPWSNTGATNAYLQSNEIAGQNTVANYVLTYASTLTGDSQFVQMSAKNGVEISMWGAAYSAGREFFNSGSTDWRWRIRKTGEGSNVAEGAQTPFVAPDAYATIRFELRTTVAASLRLTLYVNGTECCTYLDTSPLTNTGVIEFTGDGRGASARPNFDDFVAGRIV